MRVVVSGYGSTGDNVPLLALAAGLQGAGHRVTLVADEQAGAAAARLGLDFRTLTGSVQRLLANDSRGWQETVGSGRLSGRALTEVGRFHHRAWLTEIGDAARDADVIASSTLGLHQAASVAQDRGIPLVAIQLQPTLPTRDYPPPVTGLRRLPRALNRPLARLLLRAGDLAIGRGVDRDRRAAGHGPLRVDWDAMPILMAWSPALVPAASDWRHADATLTGAWTPPLASDWVPPADLGAFLADGEPPVYVGFGSVSGFAGLPVLRDAILSGLAGRRVVLASGWAGLTAADLPDHVFAVDEVPHAWLFPRCSLVMHHCGAGTTHQGARAGVPSAGVPFALDQPFWAERLRLLGVAPEPLNPRRPDADAVRAAVAWASQPSVRRRAAELGRRMAAEPDGVAAAVAVLERIAGAA